MRVMYLVARKVGTEIRLCLTRSKLHPESLAPILVSREEAHRCMQELQRKHPENQYMVLATLESFT